MVGGTQGSLPISGGFFGGQIGGNWQVERAVFGIQADAHWADVEGQQEQAIVGEVRVIHVISIERL
jgi:hypothetical protein